MGFIEGGGRIATRSDPGAGAPGSIAVRRPSATPNPTGPVQPNAHYCKEKDPVKDRAFQIQEAPQEDGSGSMPPSGGVFFGLALGTAVTEALP